MKLHLLSKKFVLVTVILLIIWFGGYELVERLLLNENFKNFIPTFHIIRGVLSVAFIVVLILWYFFCFQLPLYPQEKPSKGILKQISTDKDLFKYHALWFIKARWFVAIIIGIIILTGCYLFGFIEKRLFPSLIISTFLLVLFNILFYYLSKLNISFKSLTIIQLIIDLIILTVLIHYSGGIENPLTFLYSFHVVISGILLNKKECYFITAFASLLFITMALGEMTGIFEHNPITVFSFESQNMIHPADQPFFVFSRIFTKSLTFFLTAYFITEIVIQLKQARSAAFTATGQVIAENEKLITVIKAKEAE